MIEAGVIVGLESVLVLRLVSSSLPLICRYETYSADEPC